jgi:hypothetical protein
MALLVLGGLLGACAQASAPQSEGVAPIPVAISAQAVPLQEGNVQIQRVGAWHYLGGLALRSDDRHFGGLSALRITDQNFALALSDQGDWIGFGLVEKQGRLVGVRAGVRVPVLDRFGNMGEKPERDAEALELDPSVNEVWIALERRNQIWRYAGFNPTDPKSWGRPAAQEIALPQMRTWPVNGGAEAFVKLEDGRFLIFSEQAAGAQPGTLQALVVDAALGQVRHVLSYKPPQGFAPTDAVRVGSDVLVLNRRFSLSQGVSVAITSVSLAGLEQQQLLTGVEEMRLSPPFSVDNFEGISVVEQDGKRFVYIVSDDNFQRLQRTLLFKFLWQK